MDEGLKDILFALLTMAIPITAAVLDSKRKKAGKAQVKAHPVTEDFEDDITEDAVPSPEQQPQKEETPVAPAPAIPEEPRLSREEKRKLIIYSEIMKPKYDE